jgi:hypothetical protein
LKSTIVISLLVETYASKCAQAPIPSQSLSFNKKLKPHKFLINSSIIVGLIATGINANCADISKVSGKGNKIDQIFIKGEITDEDAKTFKQIALVTERAVVLLDSPGGLLMPAIEIGKAIKLKGFGTAVIDSNCTSACAMAWIAGQPRMISKGASVGFHAAYTEDSIGRQVPNSVANALVGSYLNNLGLNEKVVAFATSAGPDQVRWINKKEAERMELNILKFENKLEAVLDFSLALEKRFGPNPSIADAIKLYRRSADEGFAGSLNNLGDLYEKGLGVEKNDKFSVYLYSRAAERGEPTGYFSLSTFLGEGTSDQEILVEAVKFGLLAVSTLPDGKNKDYAIQNLKALTMKVSKEGYARAVELALVWQPLYQEEYLMGDTLE